MDKPLEYWISRATDPYVDDKIRRSALSRLCDRINTEADGALIVTGILAHKVISPDQDEVLLSLQVVDQAVRRCGEKVYTKVGKFRFLNQLVKLITPKYLAAQTSTEVKELTIRLLYSWQKSLPHIEKFKEVYDSLKKNQIIKEDPQIPEEEIMVVPGPAPRLAVFEDEEKSRLLKELLSSPNPDDLQAANRLIKSLVRIEDQKIERINKRADDLDLAKRICKEIEECLVERTAASLGLGTSIDADNEKRFSALYDELLAVRPVLFRYAGEAAESDDSHLADILSTNDHVNKLIQKYRGMHETDRVRQHNGGSEEECADLLGPDLNISPSVSPHCEHEDALVATTSDHSKIGGNEIFDAFQPLNTEDKLYNDFPDVPFIGFDKNVTPALPRRARSATSGATSQVGSMGLESLASLIDNEIMAPNTGPAHRLNPPKKSLNELAFSIDVLPVGSLDSLDSNVIQLQADQLTSSLPSLPQVVVYNVNNVLLAQVEPTLLMDMQGLKLIAYRTSSVHFTGVITFMVALINTNVDKFEEIMLRVTSTSKMACIRLENAVPCSLRGAHPKHQFDAFYRMLCILPLGEIREVEVDFSISFKHIVQRTISGSATLPILS